MTLSERLSEYVRACFTGLWVRTFEADDALDEIARLCRQNRWALATWDVDRGLRLASPTDGAATPATASDPLAAIRALNALASADGTALLVLRNFHRFLGSAEVVQAIDTQVSAGKQNRTFVVILAPLVNLPVEVEKLFVVIEHDLPGRDQIEAIARGVATEPGDLPDGDGLVAVLDAAAGLTRVEAENAFSLSLVRHGRVSPEVLWELKGQALKKSGLLTLHRGGETFADLGGLGALKSFCARALRPGGSPSARPRGVLLLSPRGAARARSRSRWGMRPGGRPWCSTSGRCSAPSWARPRPTSARR
jgi:hypothetical protein